MPRGRAPKKVDKEKRKRVQKKAQESRQRLVNKFREDTRDKFFKGNENISDDRLDRRRQQDLAEQRFIRTRMKPVVGSSTLLQKRDPEGIDLAEFRRRNAMQYGPTLSEIGSDIGYGLSSIAKGFAEKGTPMIQLFKGLSDKFKSGVEAAWDAVRGEPTSAQGTAFPQPGSDTKDLFSSIDTGIAQVDPDNMLVQIAKENQKQYEPFRVSNMDMSNVVAQEGDRPVLPKNVIPKTPSIYPLPRNVVPMTPVLPPEVNDPRVYQGQTLYAENDGLPSLMDMYNFARNPQVNTNYGNFRLDNVLTGNPQMNYGNTVMINGVPVDLSASIGQGGISGGLSFAFNKGGSVDKYNGLGYMFK